nr:hypothetical protein [Acidobacteriota bacterium]
YLPRFEPAFGEDVAFWHREADAAFRVLLDEFTGLRVTPHEWEARPFSATLKDFARRFHATGSAEGIVMGTIIDYVSREAAGPRARILSAFRTSPKINTLFEAGAEALSE